MFFLTEIFCLDRLTYFIFKLQSKYVLNLITFFIWLDNYRISSNKRPRRL